VLSFRCILADEIRPVFSLAVILTLGLLPVCMNHSQLDFMFTTQQPGCVWGHDIEVRFLLLASTRWILIRTASKLAGHDTCPACYTHASQALEVRSCKEIPAGRYTPSYSVSCSWKPGCRSCFVYCTYIAFRS
jgi:hypothetical protein